VVKAGGDLWVWGHNASEQLGRDLDRFIFRPVQNCDIEGVLSVTGRTSHSIALGQLGDKSFEGRAKPVKVTIR
jgi:alpha-tubulin suppressor-like RCC1 family protein